MIEPIQRRVTQCLIDSGQRHSISMAAEVGAPDLIADHGERSPLLPQTQHGFHKIVPIGTVQPAGAQDQMTATAGQNGLLLLATCSNP